MPEPVRLSDMSDAELHGAAVLAAGWLKVESAKSYGLVGGGPDVDAQRCEDVLAEVRERGLTEPTEAEVDAAVAAIAAEYGARA